MNDNTGETSKKCKAMIDAGINNPDSYEGTHFCWQQCPYPICVVFESAANTKLERAKEIAEFSRRLHKHGISVIDIGLITGKSIRTVRGYLR